MGIERALMKVVSGARDQLNWHVTLAEYNQFRCRTGGGRSPRLVLFDLLADLTGRPVRAMSERRKTKIRISATYADQDVTMSIRRPMRKGPRRSAKTNSCSQFQILFAKESLSYCQRRMINEF